MPVQASAFARRGITRSRRHATIVGPKRRCVSSQRSRAVFGLAESSGIHTVTVF